jgi:uncharacterized membrane protein YfcA
MFEAFLVTFILGAIIGSIMGMTGAGGGVLSIPILLFFQQLSVQQAAPIGLLAVGLSAILGAGFGAREGIVRYRAVALIGGVGMIMAPVGMLTARYLPSRPLLIMFALVLLFAAWRVVHQQRESIAAMSAFVCKVNPVSKRLNWSTPCVKVLASIGAISGGMSGLLGVGGGFVIVPALSHYSNLNLRSIQATSLAVIGLVSLSAVLAAVASGRVIWTIAIPFALGAMSSLTFTQKFAKGINTSYRQLAFACLAIVVSVLMLIKSATV